MDKVLRKKGNQKKDLMAIVFIGLGSNLGDRELNLQKALDMITKCIGEILTESSIYKSEAVGFDGNPFYNQVIKVETILTPENLLHKTQEIERKMGRVQKTVVKNGNPIYSNRIIDIDILLYDDLQINTATLTIPHPKMFEREFVIKPLSEIEITMRLF